MSSKSLLSILGRCLAGVGLVTIALIPGGLASAGTRHAGTRHAGTRHAGTRHAGTRHASSNSTLFGASISSPRDLATKTRQFGHMPIVRVYYPGLPAANAWSTGVPARNRSAVVVSFKALPRAIISGADNGALEHFFDTAPTGHDIYYTYYHEPEDNIAAGQFTLANYKTAWAHVVQLADAANNPYLHSTLILMAYDLARHSGRRWMNYLPAGHIISTLGWDAYPNNTGLGTPTIGSFMGAAVAVSRAAGLPFGFAEFNTTTLRGRPSWLSSIGGYCKSSGALFCTLYDDSYNGGLGGRGTFYVSDRASARAWNGVVSGSGVSRQPRQPRVTRSMPTLSLNEYSVGVRMVQLGLRWLGFYPRRGLIDGHYGPVTNAAVRSFQRKYNCQPPGNRSHFGPKSWDVLARARASSSSMPTLTRGESSLGVVLVQYALQQLGYYPRRSVVGGHYGPVTNSAVRAFQRHYGCTPSDNVQRFGINSWIALANAHVR